MAKDNIVQNKPQTKFSNQNDSTIINGISKKKDEGSELIKSSSINVSKNTKDNIQKLKDNKFYVSQEINKGPWTPEENHIIFDYVKKFGEKNWNKCAEFIKNRTGKQCREHWKNCLNPNIKKGDWTLEEDLFIMIFYKRCHGSWRELIHLFENRTENSIKNRFFSELRKIAANELNINKKKSSKMDLNNLVKYLDKGIEVAKSNFMTKNKMSEEDFKNYLKKIENKLNNKRKDKKKNKKIINNNNYNLLGKKREKNLNEKNKEIKIEEKVIEKKIKEEANESTKTSELSNHNLIKKEESKKENKEIKDNKMIKNEQYYGQDSSDENDDYNNINSFLEINQKNALNNSLNYLEQNEFENMEETFGNSEENFKESFKSYEPEYIRTNSDIISRLSKNYFFPL